MWCGTCRADVAAEMAADTQRVHCASCGGELMVDRASRNTVRTREARELLERWSNARLLDPFGPVASRAEPAPVEPVREENEPLLDAESSCAVETSSGDTRLPRAPSPPIAMGGLAHVHGNSRIQKKFDAPDRWTANVGQLLAYSGVALLTIGAVLVVWGWFGGVESYLSTGWLTAAAGQMLLFLGVVTLISGGLEQNTREITRRLDALGDQIQSIEQSLTVRVENSPQVDEAAEDAVSADVVQQKAA